MKWIRFQLLFVMMLLSSCGHLPKVGKDDPIEGKWVYHPVQPAPAVEYIHPGTLDFQRDGTWRGTGPFLGEGRWLRYAPAPNGPLDTSQWIGGVGNWIDSLIVPSFLPIGTGASHPPVIGNQVVPIQRWVDRPDTSSLGEVPLFLAWALQSGAYTYSLSGIRENRFSPEFYLVDGKLIVTFSGAGQITLVRESRLTRLMGFR